MSYEERPIVFDCDGSELVGIVAAPSSAASVLGVLVVVGGPQYRAGSHRQFVLLARALAERGIPCMRFDYRGMGDTPGDARPFTSIDDDIRSAADAFEREVPSLRGIVLWGLCDGASAACFYAPRDPRVRAVVLLNPWVRTDATEAKVYLEKYYLQRLLQPAFWKKLLGGGVGVGRALRELFGAVRRSQARDAGADASRSLPQRMAAGLDEAARPMLVILSGKDFVANEFEQVASADPAWSRLLAQATVERLAAADHTFASVQWREQVAATTGNWVASLETEGHRSTKPS